MSILKSQFPSSWSVIEGEFDKQYMINLERYLISEWETQTIFPPKHEIFSAYEYPTTTTSILKFSDSLFRSSERYDFD